MFPKPHSLQVLMQLKRVSHISFLQPFPFCSGLLLISRFSGVCITAAQFTAQKHLSVRPESCKESMVGQVVFTGTQPKSSPMQGCAGGYAQLHTEPGQTPLLKLAYSLRIRVYTWVSTSLTVGATHPQRAGGMSHHGHHGRSESHCLFYPAIT